MRSGKFRRELGGEPGGALISCNGVVKSTGAGNTYVPTTGRIIGAWFGWALAAATIFLPPGSVPLQQSSPVEGWHFPRLQQAADSFVNFPPMKQSKGLTSRKTARTVTAM